MTTFSSHPQTRLALSLLATALLSVPSAYSAPTHEGGASPDEVFSTIQASVKSRDWTLLVSQLLPRKRPAYVFEAIHLGGKVISASSTSGRHAERLDAIAKQHGYSREVATVNGEGELEGEEAQETVDAFYQTLTASGSSALLADIISFLDTAMREEGYSHTLFQHWIPTKPGMEVEQLDETHVLGHTDSSELRFYQQDGRWFYVPQNLW